VILDPKNTDAHYLLGQDLAKLGKDSDAVAEWKKTTELDPEHAEALYNLGLAYSTGQGVRVDFIAAHKWFNLAALSGCTRGQECRAEIALEMTAREIAEAQRQARAWLSTCGYQRRAA